MGLELQDEIYNPDKIKEMLSGITNNKQPVMEEVETTEIKTTTTTTTTLTTTTLSIEKKSDTCQQYCERIRYLDAVCLQNPNNCKITGKTYVKEGNRFCPKTDRGPDTFCC